MVNSFFPTGIFEMLLLGITDRPFRRSGERSYLITRSAASSCRNTRGSVVTRGVTGGRDGWSCRKFRGSDWCSCGNFRRSVMKSR